MQVFEFLEGLVYIELVETMYLSSTVSELSNFTDVRSFFNADTGIILIGDVIQANQ